MSKFFKQIIAPSQKRIGSVNDGDQSSDSENDSSEQFDEDNSSEDSEIGEENVKIKINFQEPDKQQKTDNSIFSKLLKQGTKKYQSQNQQKGQQNEKGQMKHMLSPDSSISQKFRNGFSQSIKIDYLDEHHLMNKTQKNFKSSILKLIQQKHQEDPDSEIFNSRFLSPSSGNKEQNLSRTKTLSKKEIKHMKDLDNLLIGLRRSLIYNEQKTLKESSKVRPISPSERYADIVEYISNIKKPSVPDFGFQFYENTFLDELRNDNESGDQRYRRKDQRNQQVIEQKNKKHRRKTRKMKQLLGNHLMNNTYDEIMKDQGYKVVMEKKTSRIKFENINNRRGGVILPPKNLLGVQEKSNFNTKRVSFFDQAAFNRDGKGCSADNQISSRGSRNKSVQKYQDSNQKSLTQISSVLNNQSRDVSQAQGQGEQGQGSQKYDINEIKRLILNQAIFQQMQAQKLNIEDLKSELKHIKELDKAKKRDINEFKFRNQKLLNSSQVKIQTV
eukprot:403365127